jgi:UMF1 family MFS transporter
VFAYFVTTTLQFWVLAMLVATSQGGIQALSRSYFGKIIPKENSGEFFGFYNIFGRFAAILGPFLVGIVSQFSGSSRYGVLSIGVLFIVGFILLFRLGKSEAAGEAIK